MIVRAGGDRASRALALRLDGAEAGRLGVKFFGFRQAAASSLLITYFIPPGASEGVHTHRLGDRTLGSYDESTMCSKIQG